MNILLEKNLCFDLYLLLYGYCYLLCEFPFSQEEYYCLTNFLYATGVPVNMLDSLAGPLHI